MLSGRRTHLQFETARPDGICLDAAGSLWVASPGTEELLLINNSGHIVESLKLPDGRPAQTCVLGGADGRTLFVASSTSHVESECVNDRPGRIFARRVATPAVFAA